MLKDVWRSSCSPMSLLSPVQFRSMWLKIWLACYRPLRGNVFNIKQRTKLDCKCYLRRVRYNGAEFHKTPSEWKKGLMSRSSTDRLYPNKSRMYHGSIIIVRFSIHWCMWFIVVLSPSVLICCLRKPLEVKCLPFILTVSKEVLRDLNQNLMISTT